MRTQLALALGLLLAGCATRLPSGAPDLASAAPARSLEARFVRCATEGMAREPEVERESASKDILAIVLGYTGERGEGGQTVGAEYVHMFDERWGAGVFLDLAAGDLETRVLGAAVSFHPVEPLFLHVGPGIEWVDGESQGLLRLGTGWEFEVGKRMILGPAFSIDLLADGGFAWFAGIQLGHEF